MNTISPKQYRVGIQFPPTIAGGGYVETTAEHRTNHAPIAHLASVMARALTTVGIPADIIHDVTTQLHSAAKSARFRLGGQFYFTVAPSVLGVTGVGARAWVVPVDQTTTTP